MDDTQSPQEAAEQLFRLFNSSDAQAMIALAATYGTRPPEWLAEVDRHWRRLVNLAIKLNMLEEPADDAMQLVSDLYSAQGYSSGDLYDILKYAAEVWEARHE